MTTQPHPSSQASGIPRLSRLPIRNVGTRFHGRTGPHEPVADVQSVAPANEYQSVASPPFDSRINTQELRTAAERPERRGRGASALSKSHRPRQGRPSLSDRTMETLRQVPSSPLPRRRRSSFFLAESPMQSPLRPGSALASIHRDESSCHTPALPDVPTQFYSLRRQTAYNKVQSKPPVSANSLKNKTIAPQYLSEQAELNDSRRSMRRPSTTPARARHERQIRVTATVQAPSASSSSILSSKKTARDDLRAKYRTRLSPARDSQAHAQKQSMRGATAASHAGSALPGSLARSQESSKYDSDSPGKTGLPAKSSAALREIIAKAKAERNKSTSMHNVNYADLPETQDENAVCNLPSSKRMLLAQKIEKARSDGRLNIAAMGLSDIPLEVMRMYDTDCTDTDTMWYESVDLVKLIVADNEIESFTEDIFPDEAPLAMDEDVDGKVNIFRGLDTLDVHGNRLNALPLGLRRLENLRILNLSRNGLDNECFLALSEVHSLQELRLASNKLDGALDTRLCRLRSLEVLDLSNNTISALPHDVEHLRLLRMLHLHGNKISAVPFKSLSSMPLTLLDVSANHLIGSLMIEKTEEFSSLKSIDISSNAITSIANETLQLVSLQTFNLADNRLQCLPDLSGCRSLITLSCSANRIQSTPPGLQDLSSLKHVDLSGNNLTAIDERLGFLDGLAVLCVSGNPFRERKVVTMNTEDLKRHLRAKVTVEEVIDDTPACPQTAIDTDRYVTISESGLWHVSPIGTLDRSSTKLADLDASTVGTLSRSYAIKSLLLCHNHFVQLPQSIDLLADTLKVLDMSNNRLSSSTLINLPLCLPHLSTLKLSHNAIDSLAPLLDHLSAPNLTEFSIVRNRLASLPALRTKFPRLITLDAADNSITDLQVEALRGLEVVNVSGNCIEHLEPTIGLLSTEGLRTLLVGANKFRVPRREIVDKGTGAILDWLRGRIPEP